MHLPVNRRTVLGDFQDENDGRVGGDDSGTGSGETSDEQVAMSKGSGGAIRDRPAKVIPCPRCQSMNTKFCYYNNYSVAQPRHFCRNCQRYWTVGGTLRNVPVGGGSRKKSRARSRSDPFSPTYDAPPQTSPAGSHGDGLLSASSCMQQLAMLPPALGFVGGFAAAGSQLPFLQSALEGLYPRKPLAGLQEVPDLQSLYDAPQVRPRIPPLVNSPVVTNGGFYAAESFPSPNESLVSVMAKAGFWSPAALPSPSQAPGSMSSQLQQLGGYGVDVAATVLPPNWKPGFWDTAVLHGWLVMDDRLVPHASWDENQSTTHTTPNLSPNGSSTTDSLPRQSFSHGYEDVSQPWVGLHQADILF